MRRLFLSLIVCALPAQAETVAELIAQLEQFKPNLEAVVRLDANLARGVGAVTVARMLPVDLPEPRPASYFQVATNVDADALQQVAVIGAGQQAVLQAVVACSTNCTAEHLALVDVTCAPPHGNGPDGRVWVRLVCGEDKAPAPYDWQLARLDGHEADVFAWNDDPTYAYVQGQDGSYQVSALTALGQVSLNFTLPATCGAKRR